MYQQVTDPESFDFVVEEFLWGLAGPQATGRCYRTVTQPD
jgi:hypothetical protein